jgi:hypothetical protein
MQNSILKPNVPPQPSPSSAELPSSQICIPAALGNFSCIYTHELISLILAIAVLVKAWRGGKK